MRETDEQDKTARRLRLIDESIDRILSVPEVAELQALQAEAENHITPGIVEEMEKRAVKEGFLASGTGSRPERSDP